MEVRTIRLVPLPCIGGTEIIQPEHAKVLILVKASPEPSEKYGDTVCMAGIRVHPG